MSDYNHGRRAPNVSQYLANLNTIPSAAELAAQNDFGLADSNLDFLTNAEFFDFDTLSADATGINNDFQKSNVQTQFQFGEFQTYPGQLNASPTSTVPPSPHVSGLQGQYPPQPFHVGPNTGEKRKASQAGMPSAADMEEQARLAAEEDKRRRNTAASARFRVKKKQREQALEKQTKEMSEKVQLLEGKVQQLEMENKWLKGLITEKTGGEVKMPEPESAKEKEGEERSTESRDDGVGTADEESLKVEA
ncbi:hypothetical protein EJ03DRAFT_358982 [Teratosphaeria nubilosa]|uniref:BZIP domain-containing protein n=1 Tax=Teratosphaeria nubilosa TaxID=161662 RepID=A0A6G1LFJ7_9PEZI|nr:hypothetical protein EJ03DRAFT_358982 [Teratosphaeria nubilosa]